MRSTKRLIRKCVNPPEYQNKTRQEFGDSCKISNILNRHGVNTVVQSCLNARPDNVKGKSHINIDISSLQSYHESLVRVQAANETFMSLPAKLREVCHNNPDELHAWLSDEKNRHEAEKLGIVAPRKVEAADSTLDTIRPTDAVSAVATKKTKTTIIEEV